MKATKKRQDPPASDASRQTSDSLSSLAESSHLQPRQALEHEDRPVVHQPTALITTTALDIFSERKKRPAWWRVLQLLARSSSTVPASEAVIASLLGYAAVCQESLAVQADLIDAGMVDVVAGGIHINKAGWDAFIQAGAGYVHSSSGARRC